MEENNTSDAQEKRSSSSSMIIVIVLIIVIGAGVLLLSNSRKAHAPETIQPSPTAAMMKQDASPSGTMMNGGASPSGMMMKGTTEEVTVNGGNFYFKPNKITVKKGDTVKVNFVNDGGFHDFVIDEFKVKTDTIGSGKSATVSFTADKAGTYQYYCSVGNHRAMGMVGTLIVQ